jgi:hypothetical protein
MFLYSGKASFDFLMCYVIVFVIFPTRREEGQNCLCKIRLGLEFDNEFEIIVLLVYIYMFI